MASRRRAFTLIEILVVIAIIAIIAAILFPVFSQAKESAKQTACLDNMHQIGLAAVLYAEDSDDTFTGPDYGGPNPVAWGDTLQPYAKDYRFLDCPAASRHMVHALPEPNWPLGLSKTWSYDYALNNVQDDEDEPIGAAWAATTAISYPSSTILFAEGWPLASDPGFGNGEARHEINWVYGERDQAFQPLDDGNPRHHDHFNFVACDGHAKNRARPRQADGRFYGGTKDEEWLRDP